MNDALRELIRHKNWATLRLIDHLRILPAEQLDAAGNGAFGTIRQTLAHLVRSEEGYFAYLTGERPSPPLGEDPLSLGELAEGIARLGPGWERLAVDDAVAGREIVTRDGWRTIGVVPLAQAIHHADEHRAQVLAMLGMRGFAVPDLGVWDFAIADGHMVEVSSSS
ncbi:MAG: DinB family protein [Dehalococcoidia bacterium]